MRTLVVLLALAVVACGGGDGDSSSGESAVTSVDDASDSLGAELVQVDVGSLGTEHIDPPASYDQSPSIGGDHYPFWQNCGFYEVEVIEGAATHTMEHGAVWISYNPAAVSDAETSTLADMALDNGKLLISPYRHDEKLVLSAWGVQLRTEFSPSDPEVQAFIDEWVDNPELQEAGVRCTGAAGIPPNDVRTLADGATVPDVYQ